jgi:hypothetical protein
MGGPNGTSRDVEILDATARGVADAGTENRIAAIDAKASDADLRRADFRDAYREGLITRYAEEALAKEEISTLLLRARQASVGVSEGWGPRTMYAHATNLLTLYAHLFDRARASPRDKDGALLTTRRSSNKVVPWSPERIKRVQDLPEFQPTMMARWNSIVALGPPPEYNPRRPWNGVRPPEVVLIQDRRPRPGVGRSPGVLALPFGMYGVIRPGGADARIVYQLLKTPEMKIDSPQGRRCIMAAVIAQILGHKRGESYDDAAAGEMLKRESALPRGVVYANDPTGFKKLHDSDEFKVEVGLSFLMNLDEVTDGQVPMKTMQLLEPHIDVRTSERRPLWQELYPKNTPGERAIWCWKRMSDALTRYDPASRRLRPGQFYEAHEMWFVAQGNYAGDQIWTTKDGRIFAVNEREAMIEAFRQGVLAAAGMVAVAYLQVALALILIELPAMLSNIGALIRAPRAAITQLLTLIRTNPFKVLGTVALDQAANFVLSGDKEKFLEDLGGAETWLQVFLTLLMLKDLREIKLPSGGGRFVLVGKELHFIAGAAAEREAVLVTGTLFEGPLVAGGHSGHLIPEAPTQALRLPLGKTETSALPVKPKAVADEGASVVIHTEVKPIETAGGPPKEPPRTAGDAQRTPPESAGDAPRNAATDGERANTAKQPGTKDEAQLMQREEDEDVDVDVDADVAEAGAGRGRVRTRREPGGRGQSRQRRGDPPGGKRGIDGRKRGTGDRHGGKRRRGGGGSRDDTEDRVSTAPDTGTGGGGGGDKIGGGTDEPPNRGVQDERTGGGKRPGGANDRGITGNRSTGEETIPFVREGVAYRITVTGEARRAYDSIPIGDTVVYTVHDVKGEVIYIGISKKTRGRQAINRLKEHLTTKDGNFVADASEFRIVGRYGDEKAAHALEQYLVTTTPSARYNKDKNPWLTYMDYYASKLESRSQYSRGLDDDLRTGAGAPRRKPIQDWKGEVPEQMDRPIRFEVDFNYGTGRVSGPKADHGPGVDPDFDTPFDPRFDLH